MENFGFSNSARVIEGGLFACTNTSDSWRATPIPGRLFHSAYRVAFRFGAVSLIPGMTPAEIGLALQDILSDAGGGEGAPTP